MARLTLVSFIFLLSVTFLTILMTGYGFDRSDNTIYLIQVKEMKDSSLYPQNPLVHHLENIHLPLYFLLGFVGRWISLPAFMFILFLVITFCMHYFSFKIFSLYRPEIAYFGCLFLALYQRRPIGNFAFISGGVVSHPVSITLVLAAIYLLLLRKELWGFFVLGIATSVHILAGILMLPCFVLFAAIRRKTLQWIARHLLLFLLGASYSLSSVLLSPPVMTDVQIWKEIMFMRLSAHLSLFHQPLIAYAELFVFLVVMTYFFFFYGNKQNKFYINIHFAKRGNPSRQAFYCIVLCLFLLVIACLVLTIFFVDLFPFPFLMMLLPLRMMVWMRFLEAGIFGIFCWRIIQRYDVDSFLPWFSIGAALLLSLLLLIFPLHTIELQRDDALTDMGTFIQEHVPKDAILIASPSLEGVELYAERNAVGSLKALGDIAHDPGFGIQEFRRINTVCNITSCTTWQECQEQCQRHYDLLQEEDFVQLAQRFSASYLLVGSNYSLNFPLLYRNQEFALYNLVLYNITSAIADDKGRQSPAQPGAGLFQT